jgi:hypothetical protein
MRFLVQKRQLLLAADRYAQLNVKPTTYCIMVDENIIKVNYDAICVLKFAPNSKLVMVDYETIQRPLDNDFNHLKSLINLDTNDAKSILIYVKNHHKLKILLEKYDYCRTFNDSYQGLFSDLPTIEAAYPSNFPYQSTREELKKLEKETLLFDLQERLQAYYLELAYKICEQKRIQKSIITYSHRKVGWATPKYEFNSNFSIKLKTNFGFGIVSYFYTCIKYKGLDIVPFSDWIVYQNAKLIEIINYSAKHRVLNESWIEALEYSRDAFNLATTDEIAFIKRYVIEECERMVLGLENFLDGDNFKFINFKNISIDVPMEGHDLIEFRGQKISGALFFIQKIIQFKMIIEINEFINRIEICNERVKPMLIKEILLINKELFEFNNNLKVLKPLYEAMDKRFNDFENSKRTLRNDLINENQSSIYLFSVEELDKKFIELNPEYPEFLLKYNDIKSQYLELTNKIILLDFNLANIESYNKTIEEYFNNKSYKIY